MGLMLYGSDSDEHYPPRMASANDAYEYIGLYINDRSVLDPSNGLNSKWLGNTNLASKHVNESQPCERTVVFYDSAARHPSERSLPFRYCAFADGHAGVLKEHEFQAAAANGMVQTVRK